VEVIIKIEYSIILNKFAKKDYASSNLKKKKSLTALKMPNPLFKKFGTKKILNNVQPLHLMN